MDQTALAQYVARKTPLEDAAAEAARKKAGEEQRGALTEALHARAAALLELAREQAAPAAESAPAPAAAAEGAAAVRK